MKRKNVVGGLHVDEERINAFNVAMKYLETCDDEYVTISELNTIMVNEGVEPYDSKWMQKKS